jgi:hypothetical protein
MEELIEAYCSTSFPISNGKVVPEEERVRWAKDMKKQRDRERELGLCDDYDEIGSPSCESPPIVADGAGEAKAPEVLAAVQNSSESDVGQEQKGVDPDASGMAA